MEVNFEIVFPRVLSIFGELMMGEEECTLKLPFQPSSVK
jgi:hypothetical protein